MEKLSKATIYCSFLNTTHLVKTPFIPLYRRIHTHQIQRIMLLEHVKGALAFKVFVFPKRQKPVTSQNQVTVSETQQNTHSVSK